MLRVYISRIPVLKLSREGNGGGITPHLDKKAQNICEDSNRWEGGEHEEADKKGLGINQTSNVNVISIKL